MYDGIDSMPILRLQTWNKMLMLDSNMGDSIMDYDKRMNEAIRMIKAGKGDKAIALMNNARSVYWNMLEEINLKGMAFACTVHSIDGEEVKGCDDSTLKEVLDKLEAIEAPSGKLFSWLMGLKKKLMTS